MINKITKTPKKFYNHPSVLMVFWVDVMHWPNNESIDYIRYLLDDTW